MKQAAAIFAVIIFVALVYWIATKRRIVQYAQPLGPPLPANYDNFGYQDAGGPMGPFLPPENNYYDNNGAYARAYGGCQGCTDLKTISSAAATRGMI